MTRKLRWYLLVCLAELTILPGCQHLPYFGSVTESYEGPKESCVSWDAEKIRNRTNPQDGKPGPTVESWLAQQAALEKKKQNAGTSSIVTIEASPEPKPSPLPILPTTPPLPQVTVKPRENAPVVEALLLMLDNRHEDAIKHLRAYDDATQEIFLRWLPLIGNLTKKRIDEMSPQEVAVWIKGISGLRDTLIPRSELIISEKKFCKWVKAYGDYQPLPENHAFLTGTADRLGEEVQLYVELTNFESRPTKDGDYLTKLACTLELHDSDGKKIWERSVDNKQTTHRSRSPMNDFYRNYSFYVPPLPAGTYRLTIRLADETNPDAKQRRTAGESLVFRVTPAVSQPPLR